MRTKGESLKDKIVDSISEIERLIGITYTEDNYSKLFKILGGEIEKFLKSVVYQNNANNKNFFDLINDLSSLGISTDSIDFLQTFRLTYNGYKHNSTFSIEIFEAKYILENISESIDELISKNTGTINQSNYKQTKRMIWFAGWDDYIGGMTEVSLFIPDYKLDFPMSIETFNLSFDGWNTVINKFKTTNELKMGKEYVSEKAYKIWENESDFMGAGCFSGEIGEFTRELSKNVTNRENGLLPFLKRENDSSSVKTAIVFSLFDAIKENTWSSTIDLIEDIKLRASYDYSINLDSEYLNSFSKQIDTDFIQNNRVRLKDWNNILWFDESDYNRSLQESISEDLYIGIDKENQLITRIK